MSRMHLLYPLVLAALLFAVGVYGLLLRRNAVLVLMSVELMLNAVNLLLVTFDVWLRDTLHTGQSLTLFVIAIAAAEIGLGLAIVLQVFRLRASVAVDELDLLHEPDTVPDVRVPAPAPDLPDVPVPGVAAPAAPAPAAPAPAREGAP
jgi:NADH-quinone oxidoreductase subunit K